jgi:hypothetical protein
MKNQTTQNMPGKYILSRKFIVAIFGLGIGLGVLFFTAGVVLAGSLEPSVGPDEAASQMYTLEQIYNRINTGQPASKMSSFREPVSGPSTGTMHTLDEIFELAGMRSHVPKTGQTTSWAANDDGANRKGVPWPNPRFTINADGTVTDNLTGLVWLRNANCSQFFDGDTKGQNNRSWYDALVAVSSLASGYCSLSDGSDSGDWRLPNVRELFSLLDHQFNAPILSNTAGTGWHSNGDPFYDVQNNYYWSSTTRPSFDSWKFYVNFYDGRVFDVDGAINEYWVWPVRDPH